MHQMGSSQQGKEEFEEHLERVVERCNIVTGDFNARVTERGKGISSRGRKI